MVFLSKLYQPLLMIHAFRGLQFKSNTPFALFLMYLVETADYNFTVCRLLRFICTVSYSQLKIVRFIVDF